MDDTPTQSRGRVTLQRLARELGLSTATISLALRDSEVVAAATRQRVQEAARARGYVANRSAAALRTARTNIIGVSLHGILSPGVSELLMTLEECLTNAGRIVLLGVSRDDVLRQSRTLSTLAEYRPDVVILSPAVSSEIADLGLLPANGVPVVQVMREVEGAGFDYAGSDDVAGMMEAVRHLVELGHRRIGMIGGSADVSTSRRRREGYLRGLEAAGLAPDPALLVEVPDQRDQGRMAMARLLALEDPPSAAVCASDMLAFGALIQLTAQGLTAGEDFSLIGYDNVEEAGLLLPPLTTVDSRIAEYGRAATGLALARILDPEKPVERVVIPPRLVVRESSGPPANVKR